MERKAIHHYDEFLKTIEWDEDTRKMIEKNRADEDEPINRWEKLLQSSKAQVRNIRGDKK